MKNSAKKVQNCDFMKRIALIKIQYEINSTDGKSDIGANV